MDPFNHATYGTLRYTPSLSFSALNVLHIHFLTWFLPGFLTIEEFLFVSPFEFVLQCFLRFITGLRSRLGRRASATVLTGPHQERPPYMCAGSTYQIWPTPRYALACRQKMRALFLGYLVTDPYNVRPWIYLKKTCLRQNRKHCRIVGRTSSTCSERNEVLNRWERDAVSGMRKESQPGHILVRQKHQRAWEGRVRMRRGAMLGSKNTIKRRGRERSGLQD